MFIASHKILRDQIKYATWTTKRKKKCHFTFATYLYIYADGPIHEQTPEWAFKFDGFVFLITVQGIRTTTQLHF